MFTSEAIPIIKNILSYFECKKCGECCISSPIFLQDEEVTAYLDLCGTPFFEMLDENSIENHLKHPCGFLDGRQCKMQDKIKPLTCMTYPFLLGQIDEYGTLIRCPVGMKKRYTVSYFYITLCPMGMEVYKEFLRFCKLNKLQLEDSSLLTPLYGIKTVEEVGIGSDIIFDDKYLIPFFAFLKKKH
jgi:Fe-S-cluster containining protein